MNDEIHNNIEETEFLLNSINNSDAIQFSEWTKEKANLCTVLPLTTKRLQDGFWFHIDLEEVDSTVLTEQLKVVSKIRITHPCRTKGKLVVITKND